MMGFTSACKWVNHRKLQTICNDLHQATTSFGANKINKVIQIPRRAISECVEVSNETGDFSTAQKLCSPLKIIGTPVHMSEGIRNYRSAQNSIVDVNSKLYLEPSHGSIVCSKNMAVTKFQGAEQSSMIAFKTKIKKAKECYDTTASKMKEDFSAYSVLCNVVKQFNEDQRVKRFLMPYDMNLFHKNPFSSLAYNKNFKKCNSNENEKKNSLQYGKHVFSGIQPTGNLHIGNYLGAIKQWNNLQAGEQQRTSFCIVDLHSITLPQNPVELRHNIFKVAATLIACGIDPKKSNLFVQSDVKEHAELCWLLCTLTTMARLGHLPQYKEKSRALKDIPLGLFVYPVLQAADILLYKATHVPVGEDQIQHIQLAQHLAKLFNTRYGNTFPICHAIIEDKSAARIRSLRDPTKKMSKSDPDSRATIFLTDSPEVIMAKVKKAITDFTSDIYYDAESRPGVSNLITIHSIIEKKSVEEIVNEAITLDTANYKIKVAESLIEYLKPIRSEIHYQMERSHELAGILNEGAERARSEAAENIAIIKQRIGLGAVESYNLKFLEKNDCL